MLSIAVAFCFIAVSVCFYFNNETVIKNENRFVTQFPSLPKKISTSELRHFFSRLTMFYNDNFPFRTEIIQKNRELFPSMKTETATNANVIAGKNGWLFLGNTYDRTIDKLTGKFRYYETLNPKRSIKRRLAFYNDIAQNILAANKKLIFMIAPNKSSVYPEFLPDTVIPAPAPFHEGLVRKMREQGLTVYYPRKELLSAKSKGLLYFVTDTHWNNLGAFTAFIKLMHDNFPEYRNLITEKDFTFEPVPSFPGDLLTMGNYIRDSKDFNDNFRVRYKQKELGKSSDFTEINMTAYSVTQNPEPLIGKSVWLIGDSFSGALLPYFRLTFKTTYFSSRASFNSSVPSAVNNTDFVIFECVERNF